MTLDGLPPSTWGLQPIESHLHPSPDMRQNVMYIPGRPGLWDFGSQLEARRFERPFAIVERDPLERQRKLRAFTAFLFDSYGKPREIKLTFDYEPDKYYSVKFAGQITPDRYYNLATFTLPKGFFFVTLGYYFKSLKIEHIKFPFISFLAGIIIYTILAYFNAPIKDIFLVIPISYLYVYLLQNPLLGKDSIITKYGKDSLGIYILHGVVINLTAKIYFYLGINNYYEMPMFYFTTFLTSILIPLFTFKYVANLINFVASKPIKDIKMKKAI